MSGQVEGIVSKGNIKEVGRGVYELQKILGYRF